MGICNGTGMFSSLDQAEGDLMSTICKLFPDSEICKDPGMISSMEQEGKKLLKQAEGELLPTICKLFPDADICSKTGPPIDINLTSGLKRQMERGENQMEEDIVSAIVEEGNEIVSAGVQEMDEIVSAIVQEGDALISGIEQMLEDLFSAIEKEDDSIVSAIEKEGGKQMERQEANVISKRHPGAAWEEERFGPHNLC